MKLKKKQKKISPSILRNLLEYNSHTGSLFWKKRPDNKTFNKRFSQKEAGTIAVFPKTNSTYRLVTIYKKTYYAHHIIFAIVNDFYPSDVNMLIDHEDGDSLNNRLSNLRLATNRQNLFNRKLNKNNKSGKRGIFFNKRTNKYIAFLSHTYLGSFNSLEEGAIKRESMAKYCYKEFYRA